MIYGYARVSSHGQDLYGNSLDVQEQQLRDKGAMIVYHDTYTGMKKNRPNLDKLMNEVRQGDTVIVTKLDRIARSTSEGLDIVNTLTDKGVSIDILNMGRFDDTPTGKLMRTIMFAFAEFERDMIVQRTREGKEYKKSIDPDFKEGRKKVVSYGEFKSVYDRYCNGGITVNQCCDELGISRSTWYALARSQRGGNL